MIMKQLNRRSFFKSSALAVGAVAVSPSLLRAQSTNASATIVGANNDIRVAVVGLNKRGRNHLDALIPLKGSRIVAICDVDSAVLERT